MPAQIEQPCPDFRSFTDAFHIWSSPFGHFHHTLLFDPATKSLGVNNPFLLGCHSLVNLGCVVAKQFDLTTVLP